MANAPDIVATAKPQAAKRGGARNAQRTAVMRERILQATIRCLYSLGYHQTTTVMVTKEAGVSRGAMLHHFPSKAELMIATMEHIRDHMGATHRAKLAPLQNERARWNALVDILWGEFSQPVGVARIEIMLASRSDPENGPKFLAMNTELDRLHKEAAWARAQTLGFTDRKRVDAIVQLYAAAVRGLAIDYLHPMLRADVVLAVGLLSESMRRWAEEVQPAEG